MGEGYYGIVYVCDDMVTYPPRLGVIDLDATITSSAMDMVTDITLPASVADYTEIAQISTASDGSLFFLSTNG